MRYWTLVTALSFFGAAPLTAQTTYPADYELKRRLQGLALADTLTDAQKATIEQLVRKYEPRLGVEMVVVDQAYRQAEAYHKQCRDVWTAGAQLADEVRAILTPRQQLLTDKSMIPKYLLPLDIADAQAAPLAKLMSEHAIRYQCPGTEIRIYEALQGKEEVNVEAFENEAAEQRWNWFRAELQSLVTPEQLKHLTRPDQP